MHARTLIRIAPREFSGTRIQPNRLIDQVGGEATSLADGNGDAVAGFLFEAGGADGGTVS